MTKCLVHIHILYQILIRVAFGSVSRAQSFLYNGYWFLTNKPRGFISWWLILEVLRSLVQYILRGKAMFMLYCIPYLNQSTESAESRKLLEKHNLLHGVRMLDCFDPYLLHLHPLLTQHDFKFLYLSNQKYYWFENWSTFKRTIFKYPCKLLLKSADSKK